MKIYWSRLEPLSVQELISKVKPCWVWLVLGWVTVSLSFFLIFSLSLSFFLIFFLSLPSPSFPLPSPLPFFLFFPFFPFFFPFSLPSFSLFLPLLARFGNGRRLGWAFCATQPLFLCQTSELPNWATPNPRVAFHNFRTLGRWVHLCKPTTARLCSDVAAQFGFLKGQNSLKSLLNV